MNSGITAERWISVYFVAVVVVVFFYLLSFVIFGLAGWAGNLQFYSSKLKILESEKRRHIHIIDLSVFLNSNLRYWTLFMQQSRQNEFQGTDLNLGDFHRLQTSCKLPWKLKIWKKQLPNEKNEVRKVNNIEGKKKQNQSCIPCLLICIEAFVYGLIKLNLRETSYKWPVYASYKDASFSQCMAVCNP